MTKLSSLVPKPLIDAVTRASRDDLVQLFCGFTDIELKRCVCTLAAVCMCCENFMDFYLFEIFWIFGMQPRSLNMSILLV